jgi:hypothetical protein
MANPFRYFKTSSEIIRLAVMIYVRFLLTLGNMEDFLHEGGIDISHETIRFWWKRFDPIFAAEIRRKRVLNMRVWHQWHQWHWHLDEVCVGLNPQSFQSATPSLQPPRLQEQQNCRHGRMATGCILSWSKINLCSPSEFCSDNTR